MVKSKKPKKQVNLKPEYVLDPNAPQKHKKKKKNAPDRPQPEWMFPPDEENPVLNPKQKSQEQIDKDKSDHDRVIKYLQYRAVSTPVKPPPPALLLTLVGAFLTTYGFNSTSRLYTTELNSRKKLDEWKVLIDEKLPKGFPDLVKLFKVGQKTFEEQKKSEETSSSESEDHSDEELPLKPKQKAKTGKKIASKVEETSSNDSDESLVSDDSGDSDVEIVDAPPVTIAASKTNTKTAAKPAVKPARLSKGRASSSSGSSSTSDSDADDKKEPGGAPLNPVKMSLASISNTTVSKSKSETSPKPQMHAKVEIRGRGKTGAVELSSDEESSSETGESETAGEVMKQKSITAAPLSRFDADSGPSSSDPTSSSSLDSSSPIKPPVNSAINAIVASGDNARHGSSSSETVKGTSDQKATTSETSVSSSSSDSEANAPDRIKDASAEEESPSQSSSKLTKSKSTKRKRKDETEEAPATKKKAYELKKSNTPFERVPKDTPVDSRFTNKYKSYDYADRAYQDLSVTKGKGFTKEKNKKKRGSYRGGAIDVEGGKGIKFEQ